MKPYEGFSSHEEYQKAHCQAGEHFKIRVKSEFLGGFQKLSQQEKETLYDKFVELEMRKEGRKKLSKDKSDFYKQELKNKQETIENLQGILN